MKIQNERLWTKNKLLWTKNICKFVKLSSYKILYPNVHRKDLYFIWAGSGSTGRQLKQQLTASFAKYCFALTITRSKNDKKMLFPCKQVTIYLLILMEWEMENMENIKHIYIPCFKNLTYRLLLNMCTFNFLRLPLGKRKVVFMNVLVKK